jgi:hypothetical protein
MDRKLIWNEDKAMAIRSNLELITSHYPNYEFVVWDEIPNQYMKSFFENESKINPLDETYDIWALKLGRRQNPLYSVAIINGKIVSSLISASYGADRMLNLWHTDENYRGEGIGQYVFLKLLNHIYENKLGNLVAWDITSARVDSFLTNNGFE